MAVQGLLVGLLTGIAGVGGSFAIVPALVLLIALNALVAFAALDHWPAAGLLLGSALLSGAEALHGHGGRTAVHVKSSPTSHSQETP